MSQSLHLKYSHLVFSTKNREPWITGDLEPKLFEYIGGIVRDLKAVLLGINGMPDHVHLVIKGSKSVDDITFVKEVKAGSSRWINQSGELPGKVNWQAGYGWFSVGPPDLDKAISYVQKQKQHHRKISFQEEYRKFLDQYQVEYDERYVWD